MTQPMVILQTVLEVLVLYLKITYYIGQAIYEAIWPPPRPSVSNKIVLITGAGQGIGKELALQYGKRGATVVCVDVNDVNNVNTSEQLKQQGFKAYAYTCDVTNKKEVTDLAERVQREVGHVNILVNNAGVLICKSFLDHTENDIRRSLEVNVTSQFWTLQAFLPAMVEAKSGHIVTLSSASGMEGQANGAVYSTSKFATRGLMESVAEESRMNGWNIKFTTVCPFFVNTGMCKNPRIRFPSLLGVLSTKATAASVIKAQIEGRQEVTVPRRLRTLIYLRKFLPDEANAAILDFMGTGFNADD